MGGCFVRATPLLIEADSFTDVVSAGGIKYYRLPIHTEWLSRRLDVVIRVHVLQGALAAIYCSRDQALPNQHRQVWNTNRFCSCSSPTCDHAYPDCLNSAGGICLECRTHDDKWDRISHDLEKGGLASEQAVKMASAAAASGGSGSTGALLDPNLELAPDALAFEGGGAVEEGGELAHRIPDPPFPHQRDYEFALRLRPSDATPGKGDAVHFAARRGHGLPGGEFFVTVQAAEERVSRRLRRQRYLEGEEEYHTTKYLIWVEERVPAAAESAGGVRAGNEDRVAEVAQRVQAVAQSRAARAAFHARFDEQAARAQAQARVQSRDEAVMREHEGPEGAALLIASAGSESKTNTPRRQLQFDAQLLPSQTA